MKKSHLAKQLEEYRNHDLNKVAVIDKHQQITYKALFEKTDSLAAYFQQNHFKHKRVAFLLENSCELLCCYLACFKAATTAVPIRYSLAAVQIEQILKSAEPICLIAHEEKLPLIKDIDINSTTIKKIIVVGKEDSYHNYESLFSILNYHLIYQPEAFDEETYAAIFYTSGTTGTPKGVLHNHQSLSYILNVVANELANMSNDSLNLVSYSTNQISGIAQQALPMLMQGGTVVLLEPLNIDQVIEGLKKYRVTNLHLTPYMLDKLLHHPEVNSDLFKSLRCFISGADKVPIELQKRFNKLSGHHITEAYGATETFVSAANFNESLDKCGSIKPLDIIEMKVMISNEKEAPLETAGELFVKSPGLMVGYWKNEEATRQCVSDGWFMSGDLAKQDKEGYFWIVGRRKQIIIRRGTNISPLQVEAAFYKHPAIKNVAVIGVLHSQEGEIPRAFVTLKDNLTEAPSEKILKAFLKNHLADYEIPDKIIFLDKLPINAAGKIDREKLKP